MATPFRIDTANRRRNGNFSPLKLDGQWVCLDCERGLPSCVAASGRKFRPRLRCIDCIRLRAVRLDILSGRSAAAGLVSAERKAGRLADPRDFSCVDCARPAQCYDHRDYGHPLAVEPVCFSCNVIRGHARPLNQFLVSALLLAAAANVDSERARA